MAQCVASAFGVPIERVRVVTGDTDNTPYGGGTWASRAAGIGGEAAWQAGKALRMNVLAVAGSILQAKPETLDIRKGTVVDKDTGTERLGLDELARVAYFRPDTLPAGVQAELVATRHYVPRAWPFAFTNGIQASWLEVDVETGMVRLLKHWCVEDCGRVINPMLVKGQIMGGIAQGMGQVLMEDKETGITTSLTRFAPGATLPDHEHVMLEQSFILEGSLSDHEGTATAGNYVWRPGGSRHDAYSKDGCIALGFFLKPNKFFDMGGSHIE